jgi:uncharacterized protein (TIGR03083 family)
MEPTETLSAVRDSLTVMAERYARLVEDRDDTSTPIPGSEWTVREAAVHVAGGFRRYAALATGELDLTKVPFDKEYLDARMRSLLADNPETDPKKLAGQIRDGFEHFRAVTLSVPAERQIAYYAGLQPDFATIATLTAGEPILHGYDIATAVGVPWPIDPVFATLPLSTFQRMGYWAFFQPQAAAELEAVYRIEIAGTDPHVARIAHGAYEGLPDGHPVDCVISADPVTALLVVTGRLRQWPAIALGRLRFTGDRPELGPRFFDLLVFP